MRPTLAAICVAVFMGLAVLGCKATGVSTTPTNESLPVLTDTALTAAPSEIPPTAAISVTEEQTATQEVPTEMPLDPSLLRQGAAYGYFNPYEADDLAVGNYDPDFPECGDPGFSNLAVNSADMVLTLQYITPMQVEQLEFFVGDDIPAIKRVELLNSMTGLGKSIEGEALSFSRQSITGACSQRLTLTTSTDMEVDTVLIEIENLSTMGRIAAVEMLGRYEAYEDIPVFWRVPLPGTPVDIAANPYGLVFVVTQPNDLYVYDVEGNQLREISSPDEAMVTGIASDLEGNMVVVDETYGWYVVISPDNEQLAIGGDYLRGKLAVNPVDGNLYVLLYGEIDVYNLETSELLRILPLDGIHDYASLAFNPQGQLYVLRDSTWDANLAEIDTLTGEELDAFPLAYYAFNQVVARDFAIDGTGNFYILFTINTGEIAIHLLDPQGGLLKRFGHLSSDSDWPEGSFLDPTAITVSADGRFVVVADGYDAYAYLSAFIIEEGD